MGIILRPIYHAAARVAAMAAAFDTPARRVLLSGLASETVGRAIDGDPGGVARAARGFLMLIRRAGVQAAGLLSDYP